jgi:hypothetical protein
MTSDHTSNGSNNILEGLQSAESIKVIETLEELRVSGKVSDIPVLIEFLHLTQNPEIKSKIRSLFSNLKESDAIPLIIEAIQNQKYAPELKELVSSCWENGMDYSDYLSLFVDLLLESELLVALEAYTVILNTTAKISREKIDIEINRIKQAMLTATTEKKELMTDVVNFLDSLEF